MEWVEISSSHMQQVHNFIRNISMIDRLAMTRQSPRVVVVTSLSSFNFVDLGDYVPAVQKLHKLRYAAKPSEGLSAAWAEVFLESSYLRLENQAFGQAVNSSYLQDPTQQTLTYVNRSSILHTSYIASNMK